MQVEGERGDATARHDVSPSRRATIHAARGTMRPRPDDVDGRYLLSGNHRWTQPLVSVTAAPTRDDGRPGVCALAQGLYLAARR